MFVHFYHCYLIYLICLVSCLLLSPWTSCVIAWCCDNYSQCIIFTVFLSFWSLHCDWCVIWCSDWIASFAGHAFVLVVWEGVTVTCWQAQLGCQSLSWCIGEVGYITFSSFRSTTFGHRPALIKPNGPWRGPVHLLCLRQCTALLTYLPMIRWTLAHQFGPSGFVLVILPRSVARSLHGVWDLTWILDWSVWFIFCLLILAEPPIMSG